MLDGFKKFILRGNVVDLAVGVIIGSSFGTVVNSLVKDLLTPMIAAIAKVPDFSGLSLTINGSELMYGNFINALISFLLAAATIYLFIVKPLNTLAAHARKKDKPLDPTSKKCKECLSEIPKEARRCAFCGQLT